MALSEMDQKLLERCLKHDESAWEEFVKKYVPLVLQTIEYTVDSQELPSSPEATEKLCGDVFQELLKDNFALLRKENFHGKSSLATYLSVVARRIVAK